MTIKQVSSLLTDQTTKGIFTPKGSYHPYCVPLIDVPSPNMFIATGVIHFGFNSLFGLPVRTIENRKETSHLLRPGRWWGGVVVATSPYNYNKNNKYNYRSVRAVFLLCGHS